MKVLHILNELKPSGMEKMLESSATAWQKKDVQITIIANGKTHPFKSKLQEAGYAVVEIPSLRSFQGLYRYVKVSKNLDFDLIHNHSESMHGIIAALNRILFPSTPLFRTTHNCFSFSGFDYFKRKFQDKLESLSSVIRVTPSRDVHDHELLFWKNTSIIIENWVDTESIKRELQSQPFEIEKKEFTIIIVGNCSYIKNHELIFRALRSRSNVKVLHIGDSTNATQAEKNVMRTLEKSGVLINNISTTNPVQFYRKADLHVISSLHEGFGLVIAESILLGVTTVIHDVKGVQWARDLTNALFFKDEEELKRIIDTKIENQTSTFERDSMVGRKDLFERFSALRGVAEHVAAYEKSLKSEVGSAG